MIMNVFKNFFRAFRANKRSCLINMLSLIPGLACCLLILLWVFFQVGTDRMYPKTDRIATVCGYHEGRQAFRGAPPAIAPTIKQEMPEVEAAARIQMAYDQLKYENRKYRILSSNVDADVFKIFDYEFINGVPFSDDEVDKCVLTASTAQSIFGSESPIGKFLEFDTLKYVVCGIVKDMPQNSTLNINIFLPICREGNPMAWYNNSFVTYALLKDPGNFGDFKEKIKDRAMKAQPENQLYLEAGQLKDRYLVKRGNMKNVRLMGFIAFFILVIACINFVNLSTAGFTKSSFQTGIRKVIGATRRGLIGANYINTFILVLLSFILAFILAIAILPWFNLMIGSHFMTADFFNPAVIWISIGIVVLTALLAGTYPSLYMASFNPLSVLKSRNGLNGKGSFFRNTLVVAQFAISVTLIICTLVISKQIKMYQQMDLGYNHQEVLFVVLDDELKQNAAVLKSELQEESSIVAVSVSMNAPTNINWNGTGWGWEGKDPSQNPLVTFGFMDEDWAKVLDVKFKEGAFFTKDAEGVVINSKMAEMMGGTSWVDRYITRGNENLKIVGVLDNFMFNNFKDEAEPLIIMPVMSDEMRQQAGCVMLRADGKDLLKTLEIVKKKAQALNGGEVAEVDFLDDNIEMILRAEKQSSRMVSFFSLLAIIISCLGLFGLATFIMEQKRKEIGLRRVNGAKIGEIVWLLNINFLKPVMIGFVIACPLAYYFMSRWLETYMQRTAISWWIFVLAGLATLAIAVITLVWRSVRAATENPVNALKSE